MRSFANTGLRIGLSTKSVEKCVIDYFVKGQVAPNKIVDNSKGFDPLN